MTTANNNVVAKVAAVVAGLGLVAMSFAPAAKADTASDAAMIATLQAQLAALQAKLGGTTTTTTTTTAFSRDLTLGSTGADVTALQNWLIGKGFTIAAGATGYFGAQTKAALASYQASVGIAPAAGYFGPMTRAKVNAAAGTTTTTTDGGTTTTTSTTLKGGEADLRDFELRSEESTGDEGESDVEAATAEFDVENGDARIERAELTLHAQSATKDEKPWNYISGVSVWADGKKLADMDAGDRDAWDEEDNDDFTGGSDNQYTITFDDLNYVVRDGDMASLTFAFDIDDSIDDTDLTQEFDVAVLEDGIRAVDSEDIDQFIGSDSDEVDFGFGAQENGDLSIRENSDDPDAATLKVEDDQTSDEFEVFKFDIRNTENVDSLLTDLTIQATTSANTGTTSLSDIIRRATLVVDGDEIDGDINDVALNGDGNISFEDMDVMLGSDETTEFTLKIEFASQDLHYADGTTVLFGVNPTDVEAEGAESGDNVDVADISGGATSETHTVALTGFMVAASSVSSSVVTPGTSSSSTYGKYVIKFDVTADEDDPIYVNDTAAVASSTPTSGVSFNILGDAYGAGTTTASLTSSADLTSGVYRVQAGDTETFTLTVTLDPLASGQFRIELERVIYGLTTGATGLTFDVDNDNSDFETDNEFVPN